MKLLELQQVHGCCIDSKNNFAWNESQNEIYLSSGSVINVINIRTSKKIKHLSTNYPSSPIQCFILTSDHKHLFIIQHHKDSFDPLITCIILENDSKLSVTLNNPFNTNSSNAEQSNLENVSKSRPSTANQQQKNQNMHSKYCHKWSQFTSSVHLIAMNTDKLIISTTYELYIIKVDLEEIHKISSNPKHFGLTSSKKKKLQNQAQTITFDIIGYLNTLHYSPNFNDNSPTEICDILPFDDDKFISSGNKMLCIWKMSEFDRKQIHSNNIDIMRQKFKFGKYKNSGDKSKNERPMTARIANNNIQFATSPNLVCFILTRCTFCSKSHTQTHRKR